MAIGGNIFFQTSKSAQQKEQIAYEKWAFPHGIKQRENLQALLLALFPKESIPSTLVPFLTWKELYENVIKQSESLDLVFDKLMTGQKKYRRFLKKSDMTTYIAIVIADAKIGEQCEYPTADDIRSHALELEGFVKKDHNTETDKSAKPPQGTLIQRIRQLFDKN